MKECTWMFLFEGEKRAGVRQEGSEELFQILHQVEVQMEEMFGGKCGANFPESSELFFGGR